MILKKSYDIEDYPTPNMVSILLKKDLLRGIDAWGRLNDFEDISYNDVKAIYSNLKSGIGVARG
jgi:hypothetical protein